MKRSVFKLNNVRWQLWLSDLCLNFCPLHNWLFLFHYRCVFLPLLRLSDDRFRFLSRCQVVSLLIFKGQSALVGRSCGVELLPQKKHLQICTIFSCQHLLLLFRNGVRRLEVDVYVGFSCDLFAVRKGALISCLLLYCFNRRWI